MPFRGGGFVPGEGFGDSLAVNVDVEWLRAIPLGPRPQHAQTVVQGEGRPGRTHEPETTIAVQVVEPHWPSLGHRATVLLRPELAHPFGPCVLFERQEPLRSQFTHTWHRVWTRAGFSTGGLVRVDPPSDRDERRTDYPR